MRTFVRGVLLLILTCSLVTREGVAAPADEVLTQAVAISDHGQVTGYIGQSNFVAVAPFLWERGVFTDLDPQRAWIWGYYWLGLGVNNHGQVVGGACHFDQILRPLLLDQGQITDLMGSKPGFGYAVAINNRRQVVGVFEGLGFLWDDGKVTELGSCDAQPIADSPTYTNGMAINDRGEVVGVVGTPAVSSFRWRKGVRTELDFVAIAINDRGQIIGNSEPYYFGPGDTARAYLWEDGTRTDLGTLGGDWSFATVINDKGQIAGLSETATGETHAFFWEDGHMIDLGPTSDVEGINERGQVVGHRLYGLPSRWLWDRGATTVIAEEDYSNTLFPGPHTMIDDRGQVAYNTWPGSYNAYLWSRGESVPLVPPTAPRTAVETLTKSSGPESAVTAAPGAPGLPTGAVTFAPASANPFSGSISFRYSLPSTGHVSIEVFDVRGVRVRSLVDEPQGAGSRVVTWDGADATGRATPPGLYISRLRVGAESRIVKLIRSR